MQFDNRQKPLAAKDLRGLDVDVLIVIEIDETWAAILGDVRRKFAYRHEVIEARGLGIAVWSHLEIVDCSTEYFVTDDRATLFTTLVAGDGRGFNLVSVHPLPPGLGSSDGSRFGSEIRDSELMQVAQKVSEKPFERWVVTGDFNDVAWSRTTRLFKRISGLKDPRVGRGFLNTYHSRIPFLRFPIDHLFVPAGTTIQQLGRFRIAGSDHFAITATVTLPRTPRGSTRKLANDRSDSLELVEKGQKEALTVAQTCAPSDQADR